jgi:hypothetical protein
MRLVLIKNPTDEVSLQEYNTSPPPIK